MSAEPQTIAVVQQVICLNVSIQQLVIDLHGCIILAFTHQCPSQHTTHILVIGCFIVQPVKILQGSCILTKVCQTDSTVQQIAFLLWINVDQFIVGLQRLLIHLPGKERSAIAHEGPLIIRL